MTFSGFLSWAKKTLKEAGISNWEQEPVWILEEGAGISRSRLLSSSNEPLLPETEKRLWEMILRRASFYPLQYLLGKAEFMGLEFLVGEGVLIPRPETEELVKWAIRSLPENARVLEIGTGSGCIAVSLKYFRPDLKIAAAEISPIALEYTRKNMEKILQKSHAIRLFSSDLFQNLPEEKFQAIFSNPPYLSEEDMKRIQPELRYEPSLALSPGGDGLEIYRRIAAEARNYLEPRGWVVLEIGWNIREKIIGIFSDYQFIEEILDQEKIVRVLVFRLL